MKPVTNLASGLLDVFGLKTLGSYPSEVHDSVAPVFDVTNLQLQPLEVGYRLYTFQNGAPFPPTYGGFLDRTTNALFQVPQKRVFVVRSYELIGAISNVGTAAAINMQTPRIGTSSGGGSFKRTLPIYQNHLSYTTPAVAGQHQVMFGSYHGDMILGGGEIFIFETLSTTATGVGDVYDLSLNITGVLLQA